MDIASSGLNVQAIEAVSLREALLALTAINHDIVVLDYGNVVVRRGYTSLTGVKLLSGGVGGTDLSHAICVGKGMLTAAILGEEAAPSSRQILHTIKELNVGENGGIFVITQANSDMFNFGLAVERANADCRTRVKLLSIDDDRSAKRERYSCGFILLTKILGALVEKGAMFDDIWKCYKNIIDLILTVPLNYLDQETGPRRRKSIKITVDFDKHVKHVIDDQSQQNLSLHPSIPTVALINTSKSLERIAELGLVTQVIDRLRQLGICIVRMYYGNFVTAAPGSASLTIMKVYDLKVIEYLDAPCDASGWHHVVQVLPEITTKNEIPGVLACQGKQHVALKGPKLGEKQTNICRKAIQFACDALISCERQLNLIDAESSVGNVGSRLKNMADNINKRINNKKLPINCPYTFFKKMGVIAETALGGIMGSIYGVLFESAANVFGDIPESEVITPGMWAKALSVATKAIELLGIEIELLER
jgi:dihydroxyacetone kinase